MISAHVETRFETMYLNRMGIAFEKELKYLYFLEKNFRAITVLLPPRGSFVIVIFGVVVKTCYNCFPRC